MPVQSSEMKFGGPSVDRAKTRLSQAFHGDLCCRGTRSESCRDRRLREWSWLPDSRTARWYKDVSMCRIWLWLVVGAPAAATGRMYVRIPGTFKVASLSARSSRSRTAMIPRPEDVNFCWSNMICGLLARRFPIRRQSLFESCCRDASAIAAFNRYLRCVG